MKRPACSLEDPPLIAKSIRELARACGVSPQSASNWVRDDRWALRKNPPWSVADVKVWRAATLGPDPAAIRRTVAEEIDNAASPAGGIENVTANGTGQELSIERKAKLAVLLERAKKLELDRRITEGEFLPRSEVEVGRIRRINAVKTSLFNLCKRASREAAGKTTPEIERILETCARQMCEEFEQGVTVA